MNTKLKQKVLCSINNSKKLIHALRLPCSRGVFFLRQPFHLKIPRTKMKTTIIPATIPTTAPADMPFPPPFDRGDDSSDGGSKSAWREEKQ